MEGVSDMVSDNKRETLQRDFKAVKDDLRKLKTDSGVFAKDAYDAGCCSAVEAKEYLQDSVKTAASKGRKGLSMVREQVGNRPGTAVAAAFGVGLVLGLFLIGTRD